MSIPILLLFAGGASFAPAAATPVSAAIVQDPDRPVFVALPQGLPDFFQLGLTLADGPDTLLLERRSLRAPGFVVSTSAGVFDPAPSRTYFGRLNGRPQVQAAVSLTEAGLEGILVSGGKQPRVLRLTPLAGAARGWTRIVEDRGDPSAICGVDGKPFDAHGGDDSHGATQAPPPGQGESFFQPWGWDGWELRVAQIAFDADYPYFLRRGSDPANVLVGVEQQLAENDVAYARDGLAAYELTGVVIRDQPYYVSTTSGSHLTEFGNEWEANQRHIPKDSAVLLSKYHGDGIAGLAWVGTLGTDSLEYAGLFWNDGESPGIIAHEVGHNWGAGHIDCWPWGGSAMCGSWLLLGPETSNIVRWRTNWLDLRRIRRYPIAVRPYGDPDWALTTDREEVLVDVLGNDHDANMDALHVSAVDPVSALGGTLAIAPGSGPGGRDQVLFTPARERRGGYQDSFWYAAADPGGLEHWSIVTVDVRTREPVAIWKLEEGSGNVVGDGSGHGNAGSLERELLLSELADPAVGLEADSAAGQPVAALFDVDAATEYGCADQGVVSVPFTRDPTDGTWIEFDFGQILRVDGFRHRDRADANQRIRRSKLIFSMDAVFAGDDAIVEIEHAGSAAFEDYTFPGEVARYVRWEVVEAVDAGNPGVRLGGAEAAFLADAGLTRLPAPAITLACRDVGSLPIEQLFDGDRNTEFASRNQGVVTIPYTRTRTHGTWFEADFGAPVLLGGLAHADRTFQPTWIATSRLIFSSDPDFDASDPEVLITHTGHANERVYDFAPVTARYVRWEALAMIDPLSSIKSLGGAEMSFLTDASGAPGFQWVSDLHGGALEFDGPAAAKLETAVDLPVSASEAFTVSVWANPAAGILDGAMFGGFGDPGAPANARRIFELQGGTLRFAGVDTGIALAPGTWTHLVATWNGRRLRFFADGVARSTTLATLADAAPMLHLSPENPGAVDRMFLGRIDEFGVYDYALRSAEVADLFAGGKAEGPAPRDAEKSVVQDPVLSWLAGLGAPDHDVYLGTDYVAVRDASTTSGEYLGRFPAPQLAVTGLAALTQYFWRVDEVRAGGTVRGDVWRFRTDLDWTTAIREGFEAGADGDPLDGLGGGEGFSAGWFVPNGNGFDKRAGSIGAYPPNVPFAETGGYLHKAQNSTQGLDARRRLDTAAVNLDLGGDATYYLSGAIRITGNSTSPVARIGLRNRTTGEAVVAGIDGGAWSIAGAAGSASSGTVVGYKTWFVVIKIEAAAFGNDKVSLKIYDAAVDPVHASDALLSGAGLGRDQWTAISGGAASDAVLDQLLLEGGARSGVSFADVWFDELRVGRTWTDVTGL